MKKLIPFLISISLFVICSCDVVKPISAIDLQYQGFWVVSEASTDLGKTYQPIANPLTYNISDHSIILGTGEVLIATGIYYIRVKAIPFNAIMFINSEEIMAITHMKDGRCLVIMYTSNRIELVRFIIEQKEVQFY